MAVGKIAPFDMDKDCWDLYVERLEQYFIANTVSESVKVATLITVVGRDAYELMVNLCTPARPATKTFDQLKAIMKSHLQPKPSVLAERFKFRQRRQASDESIAEYVAALKKMSMTCNFGADSLQDNLRDQFVCGLSKDVIRQRLFAESRATFEKAFKLAVTIDSAETESAVMEKRVDNHGGSTGVYQVASSWGRGSYGNGEAAGGRKVTGATRGGAGTGRGASGRGGRRGPGATGAGRGRGAHGSAAGCKTCGGSHDSNTCKFKAYVCRVCNRDGHLKRMCPRLREEQLFALYDGGADGQVAYDDSEGSDEVVTYNYSIAFKDFSAYPPYVLSMKVNKRNIDMEIDTGICISCISYDCYIRTLGNFKLQPSDVSMRYYTGERVIPVGKLCLNVQYGQVNKELDLYVIKRGMTSLLGRQWIHELGVTLPILVPCNKLDRENIGQKFDENVFSSRFKEVFEDGLGRFTGGKVGFALREGARPVFLRARPLPYALREPVERALDQLVRDGIITPVPTSDWATVVVPVMKKDGTIRLCGDFKLTLNKCLQVDHFPVPRVDDLLTKLHKGDTFSKIDLSQAYAQFEL
ncbi:uncharacterized protein K02A2.6-like [Cydia splendana]|uniref:uncharacterized protein K02A2.6-like n=1 Tax=Cydia splendana TaxID=1100963 RepID=UPI00300D690C